MPKLNLTNRTKNIAPLGLGCFPLGGTFRNTEGFVFAYGKVNDEESIRVINKAIENGVNLFDTADVYGLGRSEKVLGKALVGYRDDVVIATKFGSLFDENKQLVLGGKGTSEEYIRNALAKSMERLQTDFIDIYQFHSSNHEIEDSVRIRTLLEDLVSEGLIGGFGWSTDDVERAKIFTESKYCNSIQFALHIANQNKEMIKLINEKNILGLIRSPLASGTLSGKYNAETEISEDHMLSQVDFKSESRARMEEQIKLAKSLLEEHGYTLIQGLLLWIQAKSSNLIPIPGAKTISQIEENSSILRSRPLNSSLYRDLDVLFDEFRAQSVAIRK